MKKILSVMLAIMMLFGALSLSASASNDDILNKWEAGSSITLAGTTYPKTDYIIVEFDFNGGKSYIPLPVYDAAGTGHFNHEYVSERYLALPGNGMFNLRPSSSANGSSYLNLPLVTPAEGDAFQGWYCVETRETLAGGTDWRIPEGSGSRIYHFKAQYYPAVQEGDTLTMVLGVLMKVFGTIIGLLFLDGSSAAGIELMEKMLGGLLG
ncbi:MAG: hypothetical protein E7544_05480 [Ruminococcaceae bacterium]|nr:hypothetical protein [Oscillospiraceae bacterium]